MAIGIRTSGSARWALVVAACALLSNGEVTNASAYEALTSSRSPGGGLAWRRQPGPTFDIDVRSDGWTRIVFPPAVTISSAELLDDVGFRARISQANVLAVRSVVESGLASRLSVVSTDGKPYSFALRADRRGGDVALFLQTASASPQKAVAAQSAPPTASDRAPNGLRTDATVPVAPDPVRAPDTLPIWEVSTGQSLRTVLQAWTKREGWQLSWETNYDYPLAASARFQGPFLDALASVAKAFQSAEPPLRVMVYRENRSIRVKTGASLDGVEP